MAGSESRTAMVYCMVIAAYLTLNAALNMCNKWALGIHSFKYPLLFTTVHMVFSFLALLPVMLREPYRTKHRETLQKQWRGIVAIGCYLAANVALNNLSLVHLSLSLNQVIRSAIPVLCALLAIPIEKKVPSRPEGMALVVLTAGVMISVWEGTVVGRPEGIALCIAATFSNAAMMTTSGKVLSEKVDVLRLTFYTAPVSAIVLLPAFLYKEYEPFQPYLAVHGRDVAAILAGTSALALAYNYIHNKMIQCMSATTTTVLGEVKIVALLLMSYLFLGEKRDFTLKMTVGCCLALLGFCMYSHCKLQQRKRALATQILDAHLQEELQPLAGKGDSAVGTGAKYASQKRVINVTASAV